MKNNSSSNDRLLRDSFERIYQKDESQRESYLAQEAEEYILSEPNFSLKEYCRLYKKYEQKATLRKSFANISNTHDLLQREFDLSIEAKNLGISLKEYRRLYELRKEVTFIQEYPLGWNPIEWMKYIWNLNPSQRKSLLDKTFTIPSLIKIGTITTAMASIGGVVLYLGGESERKQQAHYQAWEIINSAQGQTGEGGRIHALQDLVKSKVSLESVDVSNAFLSGINLPKSNLSQANLSQANLNKSNLRKANFRNANLGSVTLVYAKLIDADLKKTNLTNTNLRETDLTGADLRGADLDGAIFGKTILSCSKESCTNLQGAKNINVEEIKQARDWDKACYDPSIASQLGQKPELQNQKCSKIDRS